MNCPLVAIIPYSPSTRAATPTRWLRGSVSAASPSWSIPITLPGHGMATRMLSIVASPCCQFSCQCWNPLLAQRLRQHPPRFLTLLRSMARHVEAPTVPDDGPHCVAPALRSQHAIPWHQQQTQRPALPAAKPHPPPLFSVAVLHSPSMGDQLYTQPGQLSTPPSQLPELCGARASDALAIISRCRLETDRPPAAADKTSIGLTVSHTIVQSRIGEPTHLWRNWPWPLGANDVSFEQSKQVLHAPRRGHSNVQQPTVT